MKRLISKTIKMRVNLTLLIMTVENLSILMIANIAISIRCLESMTIKRGGGESKFM